MTRATNLAPKVTGFKPVRASVIVPVYNAAAWLARTLPSWLDQEDVDDYEVILVDNNSVDGALDHLPSHPRLRVLGEERQGAYRARNRGVEAAAGEVLVFTDPDCRAETTWLSELLARMGEPGVELVMGRDRQAGSGRSIRLLSAYDHVKEGWTLGQEDGSLYYGHTNNMAVSRAAWAEAGPFVPLSRGGDVILVQRVIERFDTRAVVYHPAALVHHLEVDTPMAYFRKCRLYGRSYRQYRRVVEARPLTWKDRWSVYRETVRRERLPPFDASRLLALLLLGVACYWWGRRLDPSVLENGGAFG